VVERKFLMQIFTYKNLVEFLDSSPSFKNLVEFNTNYKYLIYAKYQESYKKLGEL